MSSVSKDQPSTSGDIARVCGITITSYTLDSAVADTLALAKSSTPSAVFTLNLDHAVKLQRDPKFRTAYACADVVTADGWPIAWIARQQNANVTRTTGADLFLPLAAAAAERNVPVFLFGTSPGVMARVGDELSLHTEGALDIVGTLSPSGAFDPEGPEADAAIERIRATGAQLCFVALGAPKQEVFAMRARQKGLGCCMVCVGAALDFVAGDQVRAPKFMRDNGLEWAWRLATNPRRLAKRYAESAAMFAYLLATEPFRNRVSKAR
jgi:exopolysaccharide biosynthesis WecB/TagA/CpsF family protein